MKILITLTLSLLFAVTSNAQNVYNNKINNLQSLKIYGQNAKVTIGTVIVDQTLETKLYLLSARQIKTDSCYITTYTLGNRQMVALFGAKILMSFSKPVIDVNFSLSGGAMGFGYGLAPDKKSYIMKAQQINRDPDNREIIIFTIKSKEKIMVDFSGLDGIIN